MYLYTWSLAIILGRLWRFRKTIFRFTMLRKLRIEWILIFLLLLASLVLRDLNLWSVIIVAILPSILFVWLSLQIWIVGFLFWRIPKLLTPHLVMVFLLHNFNWLIIVESLLVLILGMVRVLRRIVIFVVVLFLHYSLGSIVGLLVAPADREWAGPSGSLHNLLISLTIKIGIICYVFVKHSIILNRI